MNKYEFVKKVAKKLSATQPETAKVVDAALEVIQKAVMEDKEEVQFLGFGTFKAKETAAHKGRNPQTGESIDIAASRTIGFRPSPKLKVNI